MNLIEFDNFFHWIIVISFLLLTKKEVFKTILLTCKVYLSFLLDWKWLLGCENFLLAFRLAKLQTQTNYDSRCYGKQIAFWLSISKSLIETEHLPLTSKFYDCIVECLDE